MNGMNNAAFFPKLAWNNISKNKKIYLPYMLTTSGIIMMFYIVFHLNQDPEVTAFQSGTTLQFILGLGVIVVGIFSVIFLFYTTESWRLSKGILIGALPYMIASIIVSL